MPPFIFQWEEIHFIHNYYACSDFYFRAKQNSCHKNTQKDQSPVSNFKFVIRSTKASGHEMTWYACSDCDFRAKQTSCHKNSQEDQSPVSDVKFVIRSKKAKLILKNISLKFMKLLDMLVLVMISWQNRIPVKRTHGRIRVQYLMSNLWSDLQKRKWS